MDIQQMLRQRSQRHDDNCLGDVLVLGGGISGIQAALDMATAGFKVYLVDKAPTIGGKMAQLDKTYPTIDCSMCIESPKFIECDRHPNIEIMTYTEVDALEGTAGDFTVTLLKKPRYVIADSCTGCGACTEYCPVKVPDPFNEDQSLNKAVHIYFSQAVPLVTYIDDSCLYLKNKSCTICQNVCEKGAIDFNQTQEKVKLKVGAIVLSPGYETFDPKIRGDYGYGTIENVVTSLDFERLLAATGPHEGQILRPSDKKHPHKVAWLHCVGSRQVNPVGGNSYCSAVCCAYTQKQVILAKDHVPDLEARVFHNDIRAYSKDFERFYQRAERLPGVQFIRSYVSVGGEDPVTKNVTIRYATDDGVKEEEFELVVLSVGINPPKDAQKFARIFGIELNAHGFCKTDPFNPLQTSRPGIFTSGAFMGPMDIPEAVYTASAASAQMGQLLKSQRGRLSTERVYPAERDTTQEEPKVGVFVCRCGANIGRVVDVPGVVDYAKGLENVVHVEESLFACATNTAKAISDTIRDKGLNRVVIAACTPKSHEPLFRDTLREAGVNQYYFDMANIREHCSWVHSKEPEAATAKAKDIVRMSVARAGVLQPLGEYQLPIDKVALVIGGGVAGMTSALTLANQGHETYLLEKSSELGGIARRLHYTVEGMAVQPFLADLKEKVYKHRDIHVITDAEIMAVDGYVGNFETTVKAKHRMRNIKHGIAIIAVGAQELKPIEYLYGKNERVITQLELEEKIGAQDESLNSVERLVMIQCVGCRQEDRNYCARVCCSGAMKNALKMRALRPKAEIYVLFRDMRTYGFKEDYYREAANKGVQFIRYQPDDKPTVEAIQEGGRDYIRVTATDLVLGKKLQIDVDKLVLSAAVIPPADAKDIARYFKVPLSPDGFFQEAHVKLRPVDFAAEGVYLCGTAHYPKHLSETISQAYAAAGRALTMLSKDTVVASGAVTSVSTTDCISCGACLSVCTYGAIDFEETPRGKKAVVNAVLCKGDGLCVAKCPTAAISLSHYTNDEVCNQIDAALELV
ncbi:Heterodisulfide reductase [Georgfuchsia toluolica]|uniref:Heterodisulfide reductase n=1 Tax=Georgfuchsia toluolica TaxID=424218 RepID=A0A916N8P2_9PROT|nr:CoB--CoM heterodisulfide reductase iron-sulfur subunit A family protein [Georgfuchsia toluolica]CAG4882833.1 Heterodisulfide reductase [Georgfuchsia toluolica]